jgi:nucleoside-triphosphatase THEP1
MMLFLLTAPSGTGKTTALQRVAARARQRGLRLGGVLSVPQPHGRPPHPSALWLEDPATQARRLLAHVAAPAEATVGIWRFLEATVAWGNALLQAGADADLLLVDEIGPLELQHGRGLMAAFPALLDSRYRTALVVVRPALAALLALRLAPRHPQIIRLTPENRDTIPLRFVP